jgi:hypothetical protein
MYQRSPLSQELAQILGHALKDAVAIADAFPTSVGSYSPAGPFGMDRDAIQHLEGDRRRVWEGLQATTIKTAGMLLAHSLDHTRALVADLDREPLPVWSQLTLARAVVESTVLICHLLDPSVSTEVRICRQAALWLDDSRYALSAAATFGDGQAADVRDYYQFKLSELAAGGFHVELNAAQRPLRVRLGAVAVELTLNITTEAARILPPDAPSPYRLGSGAAHGRPWFLERSASAKPDGGFEGEGTTAMAAALIVMYCMISWVTAWGGYFGVDTDDQAKQIRATMGSLLTHGQSLT